MSHEAQASVDWQTVGAASMDGVGVIDGDEFVYANKRFAEMHGYDDPEDIVGTAWQDRYQPDDRERIERKFQSQKHEGEGWRGEVQGRRCDGTTVSLELSLKVTENEQIICVVRDASDWDVQTDELHEENRLLREVVDAIDDILYVIDENGDSYFWNEALAETTGYTDEEIEAIEPKQFLPEEQHEHVPGLITAIDQLGETEVDLDLLTKYGERIPHAFRGSTFEDPRTGRVYRCGIARDIRERLERERALERQRDELEALNRINDLLYEIIRELLGTPTREGLERIVCERLAASDFYQFAWIGELEPDGDQLLPRTSAGIDDGYIEAITITADETETGQGPGGRALRTGEIQVSQDIRTDPSFEPWRETALDRDIKSAAAVPLAYGETAYGCLAVYASRPLGFNQREQVAFAVLGEAVGFAIHALETKRLLFADAVLELEFQLTDSEQFLVHLSERFGCELFLEGAFATKSGDWLLYVDVQGASPGALCDTTVDIDGLEHVRVVRDGTDDGLLEYKFDESSLLRTLAEAGVKLRSGRADEGMCRFVFEAPQSADVQELIDRVRNIYPAVEVVAQRERDRSVVDSDMPGGALKRLTDRQRQALETAYRAGYFDWPRKSTAEVVAESMGISAPTLHRHLRRAENKLLSAFFDSAVTSTKQSR